MTDTTFFANEPARCYLLILLIFIIQIHLSVPAEVQTQLSAVPGIVRIGEPEVAVFTPAMEWRQARKVEGLIAPPAM